MDLTRVCILGTPRCGSQYVSQLIAGTIKEATGKHVYDMLEPFTKDVDYFPILTPGSTNLLQHYQTDTPMSYNDRVTHVLNTLKKGNSDWPLVMKIFPYHYSLEKWDEIILGIKNAGFKFVILKRNNIEEQLLSYGIANATQQWNCFFEKKLDQPIHIHHQSIKDLYNMLIEFDATLDQFGLKNSPVIHYETCIEDLFQLLNRKISMNEVKVIKQRNDDPYRFILNATEIKWLIRRLINGNSIYQT